ncbi:LLM class flavin-dependent oxidoreductase [Arthrobacter sp. NPDC080073]|uniref:LLM class flavin-dependent oxidoreductase n=1 Tax=Arthrobacter sp. NPDC080073 TaxID=3155919 RepID=UPI00344A59EB
MEFGLFMPPQHLPNQSATRLIQRDLELIEFADRLGFAEAWIGEHHTGGSEIIGPSDLFIAAAVERTKRIRLGTGVATLPYHHPLEIAERAAFLDHLSFGRTMLGVGPGSLPSDAHQIGLDWSKTRSRMIESFEAINELLTTEGTVTRETDWFTLNDAALQVGPYSERPKYVFTAMESPFGPTLAGRYGGGLLSLSATSAKGYGALGQHWEVVEAEAAKSGTTVDRADWRIVVFLHVARTKDEALRQVTPGLGRWTEMLGRSSERVLGWLQPDPDAPPRVGPPSTEDLVGFLESTKISVFGTPEQAVEMIQGIVEQTGGFGKVLLHSGHEWASVRDTYSSLELIAAEVMPHFDGSFDHMLRSEERTIVTVEERRAEQIQSVQKASETYKQGLQRT